MKRLSSDSAIIVREPILIFFNLPWLIQAYTVQGETFPNAVADSFTEYSFSMSSNLHLSV